jgi:hypothetical protein
MRYVFFPLDVSYAGVLLLHCLKTKRCGRCQWARFQVFQGSLLVAFSQIFMILRVYAISGRNNYICCPLFVFVVVQSLFSISLVVMLKARADGMPVCFF